MSLCGDKNCLNSNNFCFNSTDILSNISWVKKESDGSFLYLTVFSADAWRRCSFEQFFWRHGRINNININKTSPWWWASRLLSASTSGFEGLRVECSRRFLLESYGCNLLTLAEHLGETVPLFLILRAGQSFEVLHIGISYINIRLHVWRGRGLVCVSVQVNFMSLW